MPEIVKKRGESAKLFHGCSFDVLRKIGNETVDVVVTSPPYYGLRDYGVNGQFGLEKTPDEYIKKMVDVFMEIHRILKKQGTLWLNIGDSYVSYKGDLYNKNKEKCGISKKTNIPTSHNIGTPHTSGLPNKSMIGIPWKLAFALQQCGWILRQDIIWHKTTPMPESVHDRCTRSHEYVFLLSKTQRYYCKIDNIKKQGKGNPHSVWDIPTGKSKFHDASFPLELAERCILAGSKEGGVVLDPFHGSGVTAVAAGGLGMRYIGIDINVGYLLDSLPRVDEYFMSVEFNV